MTEFSDFVKHISEGIYKILTISTNTIPYYVEQAKLIVKSHFRGLYLLARGKKPIHEFYLIIMAITHDFPNPSWAMNRPTLKKGDSTAISYTSCSNPLSLEQLIKENHKKAKGIKEG